MTPYVAIVDYGLGNLFSVQLACDAVGCEARITSDPGEVADAGGVILPGVGAFGDAMANLRDLRLIDALHEVAGSNRPVFGICLGLQLLMTESHEYGRHEGLGLIPGSVFRFAEDAAPVDRRLKVPHVGWNRVCAVADAPIQESILAGLVDGDYMYFVHSYYVHPDQPAGRLTTTTYGATEFCSAVQRGNVMGCQFHPERSGARGLKIYDNLRRLVHSGASTAAAATSTER